MLSVQDIKRVHATKKRERKPFKRTFVGCWTCRRRKVKCDAHQPHCKRCENANIRCEGYGIQLNWSIPFTVVDGEMKLLNGDSKEKEELPVFKRNRIEFCKWGLYSTYDELDHVLSLVDHEDVTTVGPFTVFKSVKDQQDTILKSAPIDLPRSDVVKIDPVRNIRETVPSIEIQTQSTKGCDTFMFDREFLFKNLDNLKRFISFVPKTLCINASTSFTLEVSNIVSSSIGDFLLEKEVDFQTYQLTLFLLINFLHTTNMSDSYGLANVEQLLTLMDNELPKFSNHPHFTFLNILAITINSKLGIYDYKLFQFHHQDPTNPLTDLARFYQITDKLFNGSHYTIPSYFSSYYEDLQQGYNLLKNIQYLKKKVADQTSKITITVSETPMDKIIRIPKYIEDADILGELPPPTFSVHFENQHGEPKAGENVTQAQETILDPLHNSLSHSPRDDSLEPASEELFQLSSQDDHKKTTMGISKHLITVYEYLVDLVNQKRIFSKSSQSPRNFPRICSDFEDCLLRGVRKRIPEISDKDETFHHFLVLIFFKEVMNYPLVLLKVHMDSIEKKDLDIGVIKFYKNLYNNQKDVVGEKQKTIWDSSLIMETVLQDINKGTDDQEFFFI